MRQRSLIALLVGLCLVSFVALSRADDEKKKDDDKKSEKASKKGFLGINFNAEDGKIVITEVVEKSPAEKAGLKAGDEIVKVDDKSVKDEDSLREAVGDKKPGTKVSIVIKRDGKEQTIEATLGERPDED
jgi:S1-C subfamily serine protease